MFNCGSIFQYWNNLKRQAPHDYSASPAPQEQAVVPHYSHLHGSFYQQQDDPMDMDDDSSVPAAHNAVHHMIYAEGTEAEEEGITINSREPRG